MNEMKENENMAFMCKVLAVDLDAPHSHRVKTALQKKLTESILGSLKLLLSYIHNVSKVLHKTTFYVKA